MRMRASFPPDIKKGTLMHELGHRLMLEHQIYAREVAGEKLGHHPLLVLLLYDAWEDAYGREFADANVTIERTRKAYDYESAWTWALSMTRQQRSVGFEQAKRGKDTYEGPRPALDRDDQIPGVPLTSPANSSCGHFQLHASSRSQIRSR